MNGHLVKEFLPQEVYRALKQMFPLKAPSHYGMSPLFYQHFWPTVGNVVTKTVLDFLSFGISPPNLVTLILSRFLRIISQKELLNLDLLACVI